MEVVHERCCGLDVHAKTVVACLIVPGPRGMPCKEIRTFGTMTEDLARLRDWLLEAKCPVVAVESTGVYWKPMYNLLEGRLEVLVVNAQHLRQVPGRKTDVHDAEWHPEGARDLLRHGLLTASFIPDRSQRELRELTRYRTSLIEERSAEINRLKLPWVEAKPPGPTGDAGRSQHQAGSRNQELDGDLRSRDAAGAADRNGRRHLDG